MPTKLNDQRNGGGGDCPQPFAFVPKCSNDSKNDPAPVGALADRSTIRGGADEEEPDVFVRVTIVVKQIRIAEDGTVILARLADSVVS